MGGATADMAGAWQGFISSQQGFATGATGDIHVIIAQIIFPHQNGNMVGHMLLQFVEVGLHFWKFFRHSITYC